MVSIWPSSFWIVFLSIACSAIEWEVELNCHQQNSHMHLGMHIISHFQSGNLKFLGGNLYELLCIWGATRVNSVHSVMFGEQ